MMQTLMDIARVLGNLFFIGMFASIIIGLIIAFAVDGARKRTIEKAEEAGVELTLKPDQGPSVQAIEGIIYFIGFIIVGVIIVVAIVLGVSLPLDLSEDLEIIIGTIVFGVFSVFFWALLIWSPFYYLSERRRFKRALDDALSKGE